MEEYFSHMTSHAGTYLTLHEGKTLRSMQFPCCCTNCWEQYMPKHLHTNDIYLVVANWSVNWRHYCLHSYHSWLCVVYTHSIY